MVIDSHGHAKYDCNSQQVATEFWWSPGVKHLWGIGMENIHDRGSPMYFIVDRDLKAYKHRFILPLYITSNIRCIEWKELRDFYLYHSKYKIKHNIVSVIKKLICPHNVTWENIDPMPTIIRISENWFLLKPNTDFK